MAYLKGYYVDFIVPSDNPNYRFQVERKYYSPYQKQSYNAFVVKMRNEGKLRGHGKRYS